MSDITIINKLCPEPAHTVACTGKIEKEVKLSLPGAIKPFADVGPIDAHCSGEPVVVPGWHPCGQKGGFCVFTVKQKVIVELPITFGADVYLDDVYTDCGNDPQENLTEFPDFDCGCDGNGKGKGK